MDNLKTSLDQYNNQLSMVNEALTTVQDHTERESLVALQSELQQLIQLTQESIDTAVPKDNATDKTIQNNNEKNDLDDEYALFMQEMAKTGVYDVDNREKPECSKENNQNESDSSDIEDELATLLGMKCAVYHTHKWGGQPSLHNAMVSAVIPRQDDDQFKDLQVRVLFTHPTHAEMLPCPFYLDGECRFNDEQCRYSHGNIVALSNLKEAIEPNFDSIKVGSRILLKLKPPEGEDTSLTKKSTEKYHLWHRAIVKDVDLEKRVCLVKLEQGLKSGEKRKSGSEEFQVHFEEIFPLNAENDSDSLSDDSLSDTEYPDSKILRTEDEDRTLLIEKSLQSNAPAMGEWERHTRGIGSKLMLAMGYVPGTGLGAASDGRVQPVEARLLPAGKSLDQCMAISEKVTAQDPLKVEQRLKRLQKKEEERNKRAYEREKERERRNVFNFLNKTLGDKSDNVESSAVPPTGIKESTSKDLNIEQFKIMEDTKKLEREIVKLNSSLARHAPSSNGYRSISLQIVEKNKELSALRSREEVISKEQKHRKDKQKMTVF
ncbi:zinc finger CCCH-type with G patch domain-containing protein [Galleria mellonella]|uniref:Zinc finger CCCH-type with G patch domain-containing protein n=1 Tax=Galleria mellonella TaxID=7137 RepID=A0ABM3MRH9_GALME|nr:zinc finger CCCH-type with G patch domain-containing protein [Galleria mellonella]